MYLFVSLDIYTYDSGHTNTPEYGQIIDCIFYSKGEQNIQFLFLQIRKFCIQLEDFPGYHGGS